MGRRRRDVSMAESSNGSRQRHIGRRRDDPELLPEALGEGARANEPCRSHGSHFLAVRHSSQEISSVTRTSAWANSPGDRATFAYPARVPAMVRPRASTSCGA